MTVLLNCKLVYMIEVQTLNFTTKNFINVGVKKTEIERRRKKKEKFCL